MRLQRFRIVFSGGRYIGPKGGDIFTIAGVYVLSPWEKIHEGMKRFARGLWDDYRDRTNPEEEDPNA